DVTTRAAIIEEAVNGVRKLAMVGIERKIAKRIFVFGEVRAELRLFGGHRGFERLKRPEISKDFLCLLIVFYFLRDRRNGTYLPITTDRVVNPRVKSRGACSVI